MFLRLSPTDESPRSRLLRAPLKGVGIPCFYAGTIYIGIPSSEQAVSGIPNSDPMVPGIPHSDPLISGNPDLDLRIPETYSIYGILVSIPEVVQH